MPERTDVSDDRPKSAVELALERLRQKDAQEGAGAPATLTDAQKAAIAEAKSVCQAKLAHAEVMHRSKLAATFDPDARETFDAEYRRDRDQALSARDCAIERIRRDGAQ